MSAVASRFSGRIAAWLAASIVLEFTGRSLGTGYWMGACIAVILSLAGLVLALGQGDLQERLADLELREKMTCFDSNRFHLDEETTQEAWAFNIIGDARSALALFTSAARPVQDEFVLVLRLALERLAERFKAMPPSVQEELRERAERLRAELNASRSDALRGLAVDMTWAARVVEAPVPDPGQARALSAT